MEDIQLKSGNILRFGVAPFIDSIRLTNLVARAFSQRGLNIKIDRETEISFYGLFGKNPDAFIQGLTDIIFEEFIMNLVFKCAEKCVYVVNGISMKITPDAFEDEKCREDFYEIMIKIAYGNIKPFFSNLLTVLNQASETARSELDQK